MKRIFISIEPPDNVLEELKKIQDNLPEFQGKKIEKENLHLTLKFLGSVSDEKLVKIKERLKKIDLQKFEVTINSLGFFSEKFIRIIWLHLDNCEKLQKVIDESLADLFEKEKRFMGHLTIARVKGIKNKEKFISELKKIKPPKINFNVSSFRLKESILNGNKPTYKILSEYLLK